MARGVVSGLDWESGAGTELGEWCRDGTERVV